MKAPARTVESAGLYALAFIVTKLFHEGAHAVTGLALGRPPILHTSYVEWAADASPRVSAACSAGGPLFSLVQGLALLVVVRAWRAPSRARLLLTWLSYHGLLNFFGYLFTTAFAAGGDLGQIATDLEFPVAARWAMSATGFVLMFAIVRPLAPVFHAFAPEAPTDAAGRRAWGREIAALPAALATPAIVVAALPVPHWLSLVYALTAFLPVLRLPLLLRNAEPPPSQAPLPPPRPALACAAWLAVVVTARLLLDAGIAL